MWFAGAKGSVIKHLIYQLFCIVVGVQLLLTLAVPKELNAYSSVTYEELKAFQEKQAEEQWSRDLTAYAESLVGKRTGQCVLALRYYFGVPKNQIQGLAKNNKPNSSTGKVGSVIIFARMSWAGHVGIIIRDGGDGWYYFDSNGSWGQRGAIRWIAKTDPRISGYKIIQYK